MVAMPEPRREKILVRIEDNITVEPWIVSKRENGRRVLVDLGGGDLRWVTPAENGVYKPERARNAISAP